MGAPTGDAILKPVIFLVGLLACFIVITQAMAPTIESNQETTFNYPDRLNPPDYMDMFTNGTLSWSSPNPQHVDPATPRSSNHPLSDSNSNDLDKFTNSQDGSGHSIYCWLVDGWFGDFYHERHDFYFHQHGGFAGTKNWDYMVHFPESFTPMTNDTTNYTIYTATIHLRHAYTVVLTGNYTSTTVYDSILSWHFDIAIYFIYDPEASANPWTIVGQFFTFSLPGIPTWLNILLMTPIMAAVGVLAFVLIRGALPA